MMVSQSYPVLRPIADTGVLVEFGDQIADDVHDRVLALDAALQDASIAGLTECMPSYTALYVGYDPLVTDFDAVSAALTDHITTAQTLAKDPTHWQIPVCYADRFAPDLGALSDQLGLSHDDIIANHVAGHYKVYMYGFAPGFAYLGGVPKAIQVPRKPAPIKEVQPGTVMIAGPQSLIYTVTLPSGWWRIGHSAVLPLQQDPARPFLFDVGDTVQFLRMDEADFLKHGQTNTKDHT